MSPEQMRAAVAKRYPGWDVSKMSDAQIYRIYQRLLNKNDL